MELSQIKDIVIEAVKAGVVTGVVVAIGLLLI